MKHLRRTTKIKILVPLVTLLFLGAYAKHKKDNSYLVGRLQNKEMNEISGIAASAINPEIYYVHNDSGDTSRFFAISPNGNLRSTIYFKGDTTAPQGVFDCEDIDVGPGPVKGKSYVYVGDIGDNGSNRPYITIYRIEEQKAWATDSTVTKANAYPLTLTYPDAPKDAETLMVDPVDKLLYVVSKRNDTVYVYTTPLNYKAGSKAVLTKRSKLFFKGFKPFKWITAGDISKDGSQILLKSYNKVYYWKRNPGQPVWQAMEQKPLELPYEAEKQGEAIGFTPDGKGYYTTSEGVFSPIYYYKSPEK